MKAILAFLTTLFLLTQTAIAETTEYEIIHPGYGADVPYPNLDLNNLEKIKVQTSSSIHDPEPQVERLELVFQNASNLVAKNFKRIHDSYNNTITYKAIVSDAWVYSKVLVNVYPSGSLAGGSDLHVELQVVEMIYSLNDLEAAHGHSILNANGILTDVTPKTVADIEELDYQGDSLTLTLYQKARVDEFTGDGFKIKSNWMGHGERILTVPMPEPPEEYSFFKAAGLEIQTETFPDGFVDHQFRIKYEDPFGYTQYTPYEPLNYYIDQAYQQNP